MTATIPIAVVRGSVTNVQAALRELLETKAHELFAAYGVTCRVLEQAHADDVQLCGILGFSGERLSGSVVLAASNDALASSNPVPATPDRGWSAELANQLVGRFKNALLRHGVDVTVSIPVVLKAARVLPTPETPIQPIHLGVGDGVATIWLEIEGDVQLDPQPAAAPEEEVATEGDMLLF